MTQGSWTELAPDVEAFFDDYDARSAQPDGRAAEVFAPTFLAVDPARALALTPQVLASALPSRRRMFDEAGVVALQRVGSTQLRLDDRHVLVSAQWSAARTAAEAVQLSATFLLRHEEDGWQILVYLNHHDVAALLSR